jgi:hypothetical protein
MMGLVLRRPPGVSRCNAGFYQPRIDRDRSAGFFATLTCHFFELPLPAFDICALAIGMIAPCRTARLVFAGGLYALGQSGTAAAVVTAVALSAIAGTADIKHAAAFRTLAPSVAYLYV